MDLRKILLISLGHLSCDLNGGALPSLMPYLAAGPRASTIRPRAP